MRFIAFGWMGMMAGVGGLMQTNIVQEVVPNALIGRELDVLAAVVLGGARLGGGRGSVLGCFLGVLLVAIAQEPPTARAGQLDHPRPSRLRSAY